MHFILNTITIMMYKVSILIKKINRSKKCELLESGLVTNQGMVAYANTLDDAKKFADLEESTLGKDNALKLVHRNNENDFNRHYSVNINAVYNDNEGNIKTSWIYQSKIYGAKNSFS